MRRYLFNSTSHQRFLLWGDKKTLSDFKKYWEQLLENHRENGKFPWSQLSLLTSRPSLIHFQSPTYRCGCQIFLYLQMYVRYKRKQRKVNCEWEHAVKSYTFINNIPLFFPFRALGNRSVGKGGKKKPYVHARTLQLFLHRLACILLS